MLLDNDISYYRYVSQGVVQIPGLSDADEFQATDVSEQEFRSILVIATWLAGLMFKLIWFLFELESFRVYLWFSF